MYVQCMTPQHHRGHNFHVAAGSCLNRFQADSELDSDRLVHGLPLPSCPRVSSWVLPVPGFCDPAVTRHLSRSATKVPNTAIVPNTWSELWRRGCRGDPASKERQLGAERARCGRAVPDPRSRPQVRRFTPIAAPRANSHIERQIGSTTRECLDWLLMLQSSAP